MNKEEHVKHISPEPVIHHESTGHTTRKGKCAWRDSALAVPVSIIIAGLIIASAIVLTSKGGIKLGATAATNSAAAIDEDLTILEDDHVIGNKDADVILFEWSDPECPFCKRHHETMNEVLKAYPGKIAWVYRHFTLDFHAYAKKEAESMECAQKVAGDEGFQKYADKLFASTKGNNDLKREDLTKFAVSLGFDQAAFDACVDSGEMTERVQRDQDSGMRNGVQGTPYTIAINTKTGKQRPINGAQPIEMIKSTLSQLIQN